MISLSLSDTLIHDLKKRFGDTSEAGALVTKALKAAIDSGMTPGVVKSAYRDANNYRPYYVSPSTNCRLQKHLDRRKQEDPSATIASVAFGLIAAVADQQIGQIEGSKADDPPPAYISWLENAGLSSRPEQIRMIRELLKGLQAKPDSIVFSEASVGVGKSYAKAVVAIMQAMELIERQEQGSVVVVAPTYQLAKQILDAIYKLVSHNALNIEVTLVRSRSEYVSVPLVQNLLNEDPTIPEKTKARAVELLAEGNFLRENYEEAGIECRNYTLSRYSDPDDPAEIAYQQERDNYLDERIIVCTHAFLACHVSNLRRRISRNLSNTEKLKFIEYNRTCLDLLRDKPEIVRENRMLPAINLLIVDEAHTLYESYRALRDKRISLGVLKRTIKKVFSAEATTGTTRFIDDFIDQATQSLSHAGAYPPKLTMALKEGFNPLLAKLKRKRNTPEKLLLLEMIDEIREIASSQGQRHELYVSPVLGNCSIQLQSGAPSDWLDMTWLLIKQAVCVSGTLALGSGDNAYFPLAGKLGVDFSRLYAAPPIETSWLRESVTLHIPEVSADKKELERYSKSPFLPPKHNDTAQFKEWTSGQANYIAREVCEVDGGAIIACTSYEQIDLLYKALAAQLAHIPGIHLMRSQPSQSLVSQVAEYKMRYLEGMQPVWVAIISVGTGVNITDSNSSPDKDRMLTQLFLTRLPISAQKTQSQLQKINDGLVVFKQWIGRLVRRPGRCNMHLHIMDARANVKTGIYRRFRIVTGKYLNQKQAA